MRIKIIGDNNCARATRHLLRKAGFAVTEFLPADVVTQAPHSGYVIAIDLAPAPHTPSGRILGGNPDPTTKPDHPTHGQSTPAIGEALPSHGTASSPSLPGAGRPRENFGAGILPADLHARQIENHQRDAGATHSASIHFDSVDSELEGAILRHVTQLAAAPVVVDRPGGIVHSERELRIVVPNSGDAKADEAAAVAVEFGVLRGLLDLTSPTPTSFRKQREALANKLPGAPEIPPRAVVKKWWKFGLVLVSGAALALAGSLQASHRRPAIEPGHVVGARGLDGAYLGSTAVNSICPAGCHSFGRASKYSPYSSAVINDSIAAFTGDNAGALRSITDRMFDFIPGKLGGAALSGANVVDSGNTAFRFDCVVGCSAFAAGTTSGAKIGGIFDDGFTPIRRSKATKALMIACCRVHALAKPMLVESTRSAGVRYADRVPFLPAAALPAQGQYSTGQAPVKITDGTNTLVVDPCKAQTKFYVSISQTANTQLVTGTASKKIYICSIHVVVAVVTNVALVEGTGSVCATGTAGVSGFGGATAATGWNFAANGGIALGNGDGAVGAEGTNADNLCLFNSGSGQVSGGISYVVQ
jgi:hypothetical protein